MRGLSWARYSVMSGGSGMRNYQLSSLHHLIPARRPDLGLGAAVNQIGPSGRIETCPAHQHTVELGTGEEQGDILRVDAATIQDRNPATHAVATQLHPD